MRVLIIPEDPTLDQYVLKPIVQRIFADLGRTARVDVLTDPHLSGISQALDPDLIAEIVEDNRMIDLFLLIVDRDCDQFGNERKAKARQAEHAGQMIATLAWQEVEVWPLALHRKLLGVPWEAVRSECNPKEAYFEPFIRAQDWLNTVGKGRKRAMREMGAAWSGLLKVCPEIAQLRDDIRGWLAQRS